ncbi:hypothetical protein JTZ62_04315 [Mammaliicoccus sciuri]|uniref:hypothetical protein n=1 Tax=Mammaliicoccus sciuri TaxID=1296 RepID=UPI0019D32EC3|nr:hypothetical protein [Mammaliicoccus sciuri]MEB6232634.1 hypothetical protein [Mammaliicoccus sciuri]QSN68386.1 hypothetical protein JTZ62_04315 [Mammaliicoccus sciuri]UIU23124.1 hypothetical protein LLZ87_04325 [Mammaliicoccus sciuri]UIU26029.1 hypothetical protein LLZ92_04325 [Mammaliicoccus sciuri]
MEASLRVVGEVEELSGELIETFNDIMNVNDLIIVIRTNDKSLSLKITDINDIGIMEEGNKINRALKLLT